MSEPRSGGGRRMPEPAPGAPDRALVRLADEAVRCTPGCCGASATAIGWAGGAERQTAVTHPDLAALVAVQWDLGDGPIHAALAQGEPVRSGDLLYERRWPDFRARALETGVRSSATIPWRRDDLELTVTLYAFRPGLGATGFQPVAELLGDLTAAALTTGRRYREVAAEAAQLDTALRSRPVVDQACGILMHMLGCSADEAFQALRRLSQATNRRLHDLAHGVVETRGQGIERELRTFLNGAGSARAASTGPRRPDPAPGAGSPGAGDAEAPDSGAGSPAGPDGAAGSGPPRPSAADRPGSGAGGRRRGRRHSGR